MDAGVEHQPDRAPYLQRQHAEPVIGGLVYPHLVGEPLRIKPPALDIGAIAAELAELRDAGQLLLPRDLEMMAGRALMRGDRRDLHLLRLVHVDQVDVIDARARTVDRRSTRLKS